MFTVKKNYWVRWSYWPAWSSSLTRDSMMDATASQTVSSFVSGRAQVLPPQALLLSLAAPAPIIPWPALPAPVPSLGLENVSNELDELDYAILATFRTLPRMSGGMSMPRMILSLHNSCT